MTEHTSAKARIISEILSHASLCNLDPSKKLEVLTCPCASHPDAWRASLVTSSNKGLVKLLSEVCHATGEFSALNMLLEKMEADTGIILHEVAAGDTVRIDGKLRRRDGMSKALSGLAIMMVLKKERVRDGLNKTGHERISRGRLSLGNVSQVNPMTMWPPGGNGRSCHDRSSYRSLSPGLASPSGFDRYMAMQGIPAPSPEDEAAPETTQPATGEPQTGISRNTASASVICRTGQNVSVDVHVTLQPTGERNNDTHLHLGPESVHAQMEDRQMEDRREADPVSPATSDQQQAGPTPPMQSTPSPVAEDSHSFDGTAFLPPFGQSDITAQPPHTNAGQPPTRPYQDASDRSVEQPRVGRQDSGNAELGTSAFPPTMPSTNRRNSSGHSCTIDRGGSQSRQQSDSGARAGGGGRRYQASVESGSSSH